MPTPRMSAELCAETIAAWEAAGRNTTVAALASGVNRLTFTARLRTARRREEGASLEGGLIDRDRAEVIGELPYIVKGVSSYFDKNGDLAGQWVKTKIDEEQRQAALLAMIEQRVSQVAPRPPVSPLFITQPSEDLLNLVTITDAHIGMLAWGRESGEDWDIKIAKDELTKAFVSMVHRMPAAHTGVLNLQGDLLHTDGLTPVTPAHGHVLDADSRFQKIAEVSVDIVEDIVVAMLQVHAVVHIKALEGNHDESSSVWLRVLLKRLFRDDPRVSVDDSPSPFAVLQHGDVMLAFHHGHKAKPVSLPGIFAERFPVMWGSTTLRYGHSGHEHHEELKRVGGMLWRMHATYVPNDAYSARGGYPEARSGTGFTYHKRYGEVSSTTVSPEMFR